MNGNDQIFPLLKQTADTSDYSGYIYYLKLIFWVISVLIALRVIYYLIRRHLIPVYRMQREEEQFFLAMARAFSLNDDDVNLVRRIIEREKLDDPFLIFCSSRVFDPCFSNEIQRIQEKRFLPDWKKGQEINQIYQIRRKIF